MLTWPLRDCSGWTPRRRHASYGCRCLSRTNFTAPNGKASSNAFGTITGTFDARQVQLGVRLTF